MFEQKRKWGLGEKAENAGWGTKQMPVCYTTQKQEHFSLLNNAPSSHFIYSSVCFFTEDYASVSVFDRTWKTIACIDILMRSPS